MSESTYRYAVADDGTITRGRIYRLPHDYSYDTWQWYWDGDGMVAFAIDYGVRTDITAQTSNEDTDRVLHAVEMHRQYGEDEPFSDMLNRPGGLAFRLTGQWDARFICVSLDRSQDLYALSWDGDPDREWHDEIEAINWGDVYRIEAGEYDGTGWTEADEFGEEWYGEDKAEAALLRYYSLEEFPAELLIEEYAS